VARVLAEEAGWAAEWLARRGLPSAEGETVWLAARIEGAISPFEVGARLADEPAGDAWPEDRALPNGLSAPSFLLPVFHRITKD
jgi:hypothetical protein